MKTVRIKLPIKIIYAEMKFNERLKEVRRERNFTQKDIYTILRVSANCYASWEQGRTQPSIEDIKKLCVIFDISADYLLGLEDDAGHKLDYTEVFTYTDGTHKFTHKK